MHGKCSHQQIHEQDGCTQCQKQLAENSSLVDFYLRLGKMDNKITQIKEGLVLQQQSTWVHKSKLSRMQSMLNDKPQEGLRLIKQHSTKDMGYELASALIERNRKTALQNQRLQLVIDTLLCDRQRCQQEAQLPIKDRQLLQPRNAAYCDSIDIINQDNKSSLSIKQAAKRSGSYFGQTQKDSKYWMNSSMEQDSTSFSAFSSPAAQQRHKIQHQYPGLNLWLYEYKPELVEQSPIKSLRMPRRSNEQRSRYKSKY